MIRVKIKSYSAANIQDVPYIAEDDVLIYSNAISSFYCHRLKFSRLSAHIIRRNFINRRNNGNNCLIFLFVSSEFTFRMLPSSSFHFACDSMHLSTYNQMLSFIGYLYTTFAKPLENPVQANSLRNDYFHSFACLVFYLNFSSSIIVY